MKNAKFTVVFNSHVLANGSDTEKSQDKFRRDRDNNLVFQQSWFYSAFNQALKIAKIRGIKPADICMDLSVCARTEVYERKYGDNKLRTHEAIMPGVEVTFDAMVADHVTESSLRDILEKMGKFVGLSPYGHNLGYGRFSVVRVSVDPSEDNHVITETH